MKKIWLLLFALSTWGAARAPGFYDYKVKTLEGKAVSLGTYKDKVVLVVNVASECGFTPQYEGLQTLYDKYSPQGLVILGFPCNDFGGQEPGSSQEIRQFCTSKFHVTFPMFEKISVHDEPLYQFLGAQAKKPSWNFGKYLVSRKGQVLGFFGSTVAPDSEDLKKAIETALSQK